MGRNVQQKIKGRPSFIFFPDFPRLQGWVGGWDQIWKIPDFFFEPFPELVFGNSMFVDRVFL